MLCSNRLSYTDKLYTYGSIDKFYAFHEINPRKDLNKSIRQRRQVYEYYNNSGRPSTVEIIKSKIGNKSKKLVIKRNLTIIRNSCLS